MLGLIIVGKYNTIAPKIKEIWPLKENRAFHQVGVTLAEVGSSTIQLGRVGLTTNMAICNVIMVDDH